MREERARRDREGDGKRRERKKNSRKTIKRLTRDDQDVRLDLPLALQHHSPLGKLDDLLRRHARQSRPLQDEPPVGALPAEGLRAVAPERRREALDARGPVEAARKVAGEGVGPGPREQNGDEEDEEELAGEGDDPA